MSVERLRQAFGNFGNYRFYILYGPGIDDAFITHDQKEMNIESVLVRFLKRHGYEQVLFYAPHRPIYGIDENDAIARIDFSGHGSYSPTQQTPEMVHLTGGPFGSRMILRPSTAAAQMRSTAMGDIHALAILNQIMLDDQQAPTALIWSHAETALSYFEDPRLLAGYMGDWAQLPARNPNICLFLFSSDTYDRLEQIAEMIPVPEVRSVILRSQAGGNRNYHLVNVPSPEESEISSLVEYAQRLYGFSIKEKEYRRMVRWMAAERLRARDWLVRLSEISEFDQVTARKQGWFLAHRGDTRSIQQRLDALVGLAKVKDRVYEMTAWLMLQQKKKKQTQTQSESEVPLLHLVFTGNPGTGKTTVARLIGEIYHDIGMLKRGHIVEAKASDLVAEYVGGTATKTNKLIDSALDGVLFIDEAYRLTEPERGGFGQEAVDTLLTRMEDDRGRLVVIVAGYPDKMMNFINSNPGLPRRFPLENRFEFEDYSVDELCTILFHMLTERDIVVQESMQDTLREIVHVLRETRDETFGNAGEMRNLVDALDRRRAARLMRQNLPEDAALDIMDIPDSYRGLIRPPTIERGKILAILEDLAGAVEFKAYIENLVTESTGAVSESIGKGSSSPDSLIFEGNPGTGEVNAAEIYGRVLHELGMLRKGHLVQATRLDLFASYVGQTATRTREKVKEALDGVLLISDLSAFFRRDGGGVEGEAFDALRRGMEDFHARLAVVLTGTQEEINRLRREYPKLVQPFAATIHFPDLKEDELTDVIAIFARSQNIDLPDRVREKAQVYLATQAVAQQQRFLQGQAAEQLFKLMVANMLRREARRKGKRGMSAPHAFTLEDVPDAPVSPAVENLGAADSKNPFSQWVVAEDVNNPSEVKPSTRKKPLA